MPLAARRIREKEERAEQIVAAAEKVFFAKGFAQTSMDEIAKEAQLSRALLYVYYKDKAAIMRAVMLRAMQTMVHRFHTAMDKGKTGMEQIRGIGRAYYEFSIEESNYFDVLTELNTFPMPQEPDELMEAMGSCNADINEMMVSALEHGIQDGTIDPDHVSEPLLTAFILKGSLHGVIMSTRQQKRHVKHFPDSEKLVLESIEMMCYAMQGRNSQRGSD